MSILGAMVINLLCSAHADHFGILFSSELKGSQKLLVQNRIRAVDMFIIYSKFCLLLCFQTLNCTDLIMVRKSCIFNKMLKL